MQRDLISVIMSTYNESLDWIERSVESILEQTYKNIEFIIIVDNPNRIELRDMLMNYEKQDQRIKLIFNETNLGLVKSLNLALDYCTGKYIARMDADDVSFLHRLEYQKAYLELHKLDFVFSGVQFIDEENSILYEGDNSALDAEKTRRKLENINISYHSTWFLKKEVYDVLGGYREIKYCEDYDFLLRCLSKDFKISKMNGAMVKYRLRQDSISRSYSLEQFLNSKSILKLYRKNLLEDDLKVADAQVESKKLANEKEKNKFTTADNFYFTGVNLIRNGKKTQGLVRLAKSVSISKYYFLRNIDVLIHKLSARN